jgi:hypothetical protein
MSQHHLGHIAGGGIAHAASHQVDLLDALGHRGGVVGEGQCPNQTIQVRVSECRGPFLQGFTFVASLCLGLEKSRKLQSPGLRQIGLLHMAPEVA